MDWVYNEKEVKYIDDLPKDCMASYTRFQIQKLTNIILVKKIFTKEEPYHHLKVTKEKEK